MNSEVHEAIECPGISFERGFVQVYTGEGKGKAATAIGLAVRAAGAGPRVFFAQFIKSECASEIEAMEQFGDRIVCRQNGRGGWMSGRPKDEDVMSARSGLDEVRRVIVSSDYQVVILDEADMAVWFDLLEVEDLLALIDLKPERTELVFTGRHADPRLIKRADLVTEMREVKHYFRQGIMARKGIES